MRCATWAINRHGLGVSALVSNADERLPRVGDEQLVTGTTAIHLPHKCLNSNLECVIPGVQQSLSLFDCRQLQ